MNASCIRRSCMQIVVLSLTLACALSLAASGPELNNRAVLAARQGDAASAKRDFEQAIASNDAHKALYALNYAKFLRANDPPAAVAAAREALAAAPDSDIAMRYLGDLLWKTNPEQMLPLAVDVMRRGHTDIATQFALRCLRSQKRPAAEKRAWLILLASRLANEYSISANVRDAIASNLATLNADQDVGAGSQQLRDVIASPPADYAAINWWANQYNAIAPATGSARTAMREVLLAAGAAHPNEPVSAERYFRAAIELGDGGPDADAFLRLVELYATRNSATALKQLMDRYQWDLFSEKAAAYARQDWAEIYRLHLALGMTYAYLNVYSSDSEFQNGVFQLSHAQRAAEALNRQAEQQGRTTRTALPSLAVRKLADGYRATQRADLAAKTLLAGAESLRDHGYPGDSRELLRSITPADLRGFDTKERSRYTQAAK